MINLIKKTFTFPEHFTQNIVVLVYFSHVPGGAVVVVIIW